MQAHALTPGDDAGFGPPQSARQKARRNAVADGPRPSRFQTLVSIGAVAAMLIVLIGAAWIGRSGGGPVEPEPEHYAAMPLGTATPVSDSSVAESWLTPIHWEECTAEPMTSEEYVEIIQSDIDLSGRSYEMVGPPAPETTNDAISSLRTWSACTYAPYGVLDPNQSRSLSTDAYLNSTASQLDIEDTEELREGHPAFEDMRRHFESLPFSTYFIVIGDFRYEATTPVPDMVMTEIEARNAAPFVSQAYNPDLAVELADGRVAVPATYLYRTDDLPQDYYFITVYIMAEEAGQWLLDEEIFLCVGECEPPATPLASPVATPDARAGD